MTTELSAAARVAAKAVDRATLRADLAAIVKIPSITGSEGLVAADLARRAAGTGLAVELLTPDPATIRSYPAWPGEEMTRTTLPIVFGRLGRPDGRRIVLSGHTDVVPPGDPATWTSDPWGAEVRDGASVWSRRLRHEGRCGGDPGARSGRSARPGDLERARRRADRGPRPVRGGRWPGDARRDPGRRRPATWRSSPSRRTSTSWSPTPAPSRSG